MQSLRRFCVAEPKQNQSKSEMNDRKVSIFQRIVSMNNTFVNQICISNEMKTSYQFKFFSQRNDVVENGCSERLPHRLRFVWDCH